MQFLCFLEGVLIRFMFVVLQGLLTGFRKHVRLLLEVNRFLQGACFVFQGFFGFRVSKPGMRVAWSLSPKPLNPPKALSSKHLRPYIKS